MDAGAYQPRGTVADIAAKHGMIRRVVHSATDSRGEGQRARHDIVRRNIRLIWLDLLRSMPRLLLQGSRRHLLLPDLQT